MAIELINLGTDVNDGTGDPLREGGQKINENFTQLAEVGGWVYYKDGLGTTATQVFTGTPSQLLIDGLGTTSENSYAPNGETTLWDSDTLNPINIGDSYSVRIDLNITATSSNPTRINLGLDIGATPDGTGSGGSILITEGSKTLKTGVPQNLVFSFPIFSLTTFKTNGGTFWLSADSGTVTVTNRAITIVRTSSGSI